MSGVKIEYRCKKHPKVILAKVNKAELERRMRVSTPASIPAKPMYCPKCDRYYYGWECQEREVKD